MVRLRSAGISTVSPLEFIVEISEPAFAFGVSGDKRMKTGSARQRLSRGK